MVKYLIQDIIPPERRNGNHKHRESADAPKALNHQVHLGEYRGTKKATRITPHLHKEVHGVEHAVHTPHTEREPVEQNVVSHDNATHAQKYFDEEFLPRAVHGSAHRRHGDGTQDAQTSFLRNWLPWIFGLFGVLAVILFAMNFFGGATITVAPKKETMVLDQKMSAFKNPASTELPFSVIKVTLDETREVPATGEKTVTAKASGRIIVYNKQTTTQRLIKNTRFQAPNGKIYRISDSINVPKATTASGKVTPGSIEVTVYADEAGPDWNTGPTDFTLPGLKGSPTFDKVYARGKGSITGGASGVIKTVTDADMKVARDEIRVGLETKLRTKARGDLAPTQISYDDAIIVELGDASLSNAPASSPDKAVVGAAGTLYMVTFDKELLTQAIVDLIIQQYKGESVVIENLEALSIELPAMKGSELWERDRIDFTLRGNPVLEWSIDADGIRKALYGTPKQSFKTIMAQFPMIQNAEAEVRPTWKRSFPTKEEDIRIEIVDPVIEEKT